ncbi:sugar-binding transcriptional regulator [uncultured Jatrophihabitans sp.]|uniref:sugar-binding transcriptional regulator n=1 Tax=uncultured Jatrophihabitans sp. TaxID=1610747 RepID=UPI0035CBC776
MTARVARRFYLENKSKIEIADELGMSRFRVARLLDAARRDGLVKIEINAPDRVDVQLCEDLQRRFMLQHAIVIDVPEDDPIMLRRMLGRMAGDVLRDTVTDGDVLGLAWARSLKSMYREVGRLAPCPVVQLTGALEDPDGSDIIDGVRRVARAGGGTPHVFYAPLVTPDLASARVVRRQPDVSRAMELARTVTVAVVGIGAWRAGLSTVFDHVEDRARREASSLGTIGEISGAFIDAQGRPVASPLSKRVIGLTSDTLSAIRTVLGVAYGPGKAPVVAAAVRAGLVNSLVTHSALARALLDETEAP